MNNSRFFFVIGGQRCGSTFLYEKLDEHADICMARPMRPEPKYFCGKQTLGTLSVDQYVSTFFLHRKSELVLGEKSTSYYEDPFVPEKIYSLFPEAKLLFILRNPIDRAISNYKFSVKNGFEKRPLEEALLLNKIQSEAEASVSPFNYLGRGEYMRFLRRFENFFSKSSIKIIIMEELINDSSLMNAVYQFLGLNPISSFEKYGERINASQSDEIGVSDFLFSYLKDYYKQTIAEVESRMNRKIYAWK